MNLHHDRVSWRLCELLEQAGKKLQMLTDGDFVERQGVAFGDLRSDTEIKADRVVGEFLRDTIVREAAWFDAGRITVESLGDFTGITAGRRWYCIDPLDGSLNYKNRKGTLGLPHTACVTVLDRSDAGTTFGNVVAAAVYDFRSEDTWCAWVETNDETVRVVTDVNGDILVPDTGDEAPFDLGSMIVFGESYYPDNREMLARAFAGRKGWLRSPGSAAYEMACVSNGIASGFICGTQKQHELGAGMLLVQGAGGVVTDFDGVSLATRTFDFTTQIPVIMGRTPRIHADLLELVRGAIR